MREEALLADHPWLGPEPELVMVQGVAAELLLGAALGVGGHRAHRGEYSAEHLRTAATMSAQWLEQLAGWFAQFLADQAGGPSLRPKVAGALVALRHDARLRAQVQSLVALGGPGKAAIWLLREVRGDG